MIDPQETHHLEIAEHVTYILRRASDGPAILAEAVRMAGLPTDTLDKSGAAVTLVQLSRSWPWPEAPEERTFYEFVRAREREQRVAQGDQRPVLLNRPFGDQSRIEPASEEAQQLLEKLHADEEVDEEGAGLERVVIWSPGREAGCVSVKHCSPSWYYEQDDRPGILFWEPPTEGLTEEETEAEEERLRAEHQARKEAFQPSLPAAPRVLLTYPLSTPYLFTWEVTGHEPKAFWPIWDLIEEICFAYVRVYDQAERYGVWGHDIGDLVIEGLAFYPALNLVVPSIGS